MIEGEAMKEKLQKAFEEQFGDRKDVKVYFAPGRVNLIGEHTDYNGGHVFPCALTIGTYVAVRKNDKKKLRMFSLNFPQGGKKEVDLNELVLKKEDGWANYPKGVIWALKEKGYECSQGIDFVYYGNLPNSSGLSSSASIEVVTAYATADIFGWGIPRIELACISQYAENKFNGVKCGIMDQFAIAMGKKDHAIFLNTNNLNYEYAKQSFDGVKIIIACSNKKRGLLDSKYNERRTECEMALAKLQKSLPIQSLGELTTEQFDMVSEQIVDEVQRKRARHAVYENQRTIQAVTAWKENDCLRFAELMKASHDSLRDDYEVTGKELDTLVEAALLQPGVIASRMTGAGFGGCTVTIVKEESIDLFIQEVGDIYKKEIGYAADFYVVEIGDGPYRL